MDHKTLFTYHGHQSPNDCMELTLEEIYQAFKQRLIEELTVEPVSIVKGPIQFGQMNPVMKGFVLVDNTPEQSGGD